MTSPNVYWYVIPETNKCYALQYYNGKGQFFYGEMPLTEAPKGFYIDSTFKNFTIRPNGSVIAIDDKGKFWTLPNYKDINNSTAFSGPFGSSSNDIISITTFNNCKEGFFSSISEGFTSLIEGFSNSPVPSYNINAPTLVAIKGQAFWGTGESSSDNTTGGRSLQECTARCSSTPNCTGATYNLNDHERPYCLLRSGEGNTTPALKDDYAIVPKSKQLFKIVESINYELNLVNNKIRKKINDVHSIYGRQVQDRDSNQYSLVSQYDYLNGERDKINEMIKEYQTLEETENEMGIYTTKNYFIFFLFFIIVFIACIVLAMSSVDQNTSTATIAIVNSGITSVKSIASSINWIYVMLGIIVLIIIAHLYNQYITAIYNNAPSLKRMGQLGVVYFIFIIVIIFIAISYFNKSNTTSYLPNLPNLPNLNK